MFENFIAKHLAQQHPFYNCFAFPPTLFIGLERYFQCSAPSWRLTLNARYGVERALHEQCGVADVVVLGLDDAQHLSLQFRLHLAPPSLRRVQQVHRRVQDQTAAQRVERVDRVAHVDVLHGGLRHGRVDLHGRHERRAGVVRNKKE